MSIWKSVATGGFLAGAGMLLYGAAVEADRVVIEKLTLALPSWPERLAGFRIAVLADFHLRGPRSLQLAKRAIAAALSSDPDMVAIVGDVVGTWTLDSAAMIGEAFEQLRMMEGRAVAIPGNHDYHQGSPELMRPILKEYNVRLLRNQSWHHEGITWVGVDSASASRANPWRAMRAVSGPAVCLWHEPDLVAMLPHGCSLMLSGHTHGGQFRFPGGFTPMHTELGRAYPRGYYPDAPTPLYVSRGIGTTGPPSRFNCAPEVSVLTLVPR
jgi:predicted MPP superfamily phosphohydrolase